MPVGAKTLYFSAWVCAQEGGVLILKKIKDRYYNFSRSVNCKQQLSPKKHHKSSTTEWLDTVTDQSKKMAYGVTMSPAPLCSREGKLLFLRTPWVRSSCFFFVPCFLLPWLAFQSQFCALLLTILIFSSNVPPCSSGHVLLYSHQERGNENKPPTPPPTSISS